MAFIEIENLLKERMGLDATSIGSSSIARAVQQRLSACNLKDPGAYLQILRESESELQELIEAVVVPETWFFRGSESFIALACLVQEWLRTQEQGVLRLLSLPCSTGEEPYSMAMALRDAGFPSDRFRVDAVDISARALAEARRGIYGANAFRGKELAYRDRYFEQKGAVYHLAEAVRAQVNFQQGNLFADALLPGGEIYDVIFCRNVLIYFDPSAQDRVVKVLERLLTAKGLLFVGPSETALLLRGNFASAKVPLAFAFRKGKPARDPRVEAAPLAALRSAAPRNAPSVAVLKSVRPPPEKRVAIPGQTTMVSPEKTRALGLEEAVRLADAGNSVEAALLCEKHLQTYGPSVETLHLLGLLSDAGGNHSEAANWYRKALYLDPNHSETLAHLALLLEKQGRKPEAQVLRNRASRLKEGSRKQHG